MKSHWVNGDPIGSERARGKDRSERRGRYDPGLTPSEKRVKGELMNQFRRTGEGPGGRSEAYVNSPVWCGCGRRMKVDGCSACERCMTYPQAWISAESYAASLDDGRQILALAAPGELVCAPNGRGLASRIRHKAARAARKLSDEYLEPRRQASKNFLAMLPKFSAVPTTPAKRRG